VEHFDDVAVLRDGKLILAEQDKNTSKPSSKLLNDRSRALWRTLQIWLQLRERPEGEDCKRHLLFVNRWVATPLATQLRDRALQATPTSCDGPLPIAAATSFALSVIHTGQANPRNCNRGSRWAWVPFAAGEGADEENLAQAH